ncbi:MAG: DEAD/DEAH box helicase family protein, partial [Gammaproteobacteria bacterium]|nr:DEAD/DEAH box helicase family protein [Gammaproteobacteria bacterium]
METITTEFLDKLINFAPENSGVSESVKLSQREGTVAAFNMLARNRCAYLADEVGMGKTYVALGVLCLLRYFNPHTRALVIAPRQNIQQKWTKELKNFVRNNWKLVGNRVKSLESTPVWEPIECQNLAQLAHEALTNQDRDFFLRMTSFSLSTKNEADRIRARDLLVKSVPWLCPSHIDVNSPDRFLESYSVALNGALPPFDLVIVDEAHNLKYGFGTNVSNRNRVMGLALGHESGHTLHRNWFKPVVQRVLLLSATPFENDYADIKRQLDIFGFGNTRLGSSKEDDEPLNISVLSDLETSSDHKRETVKRLLIRRTSGLVIDGKRYTKNMYRREWRKGGVKTYDKPIRIEDVKTRLVIALMQKKVSEILQTEKFNNSFQIGMLSSFESFAQDVRTAMRHVEKPSEHLTEENGDSESTFDDTNQQRSLCKEERDGIDSNAIAEISRSYYKNFNAVLPHPKLDRIVESLEDVFDTGEKALIFVRRVATVDELAGRLNRVFNAWIKRRMEVFLPHLNDEIQRLFMRFKEESDCQKRLESDAHENNVEKAQNSQTVDNARNYDLRDDLELDTDQGGTSSFFEWFFRGLGPKGVLSGAAFHRNRLSSTASIIFEDNYVANLLQTEPSQVCATLASKMGISSAHCSMQLRSIAYSYFQQRSKQKTGYPRLYVYESYQVAALVLLRRLNEDAELAVSGAKVILDERYPNHSPPTIDEVPQGFPSAEDILAIQTIFTEVRKRPILHSNLWPEDESECFRIRFRRGEQRRELFSAVARLGAAYIDLYLMAMKSFKTFRFEQQDQDTTSQLAEQYVELLEKQRNESGFNAYCELFHIASNFDTLVAVNFPDLEQQSLPSLARYFGTILGHQVPVGGSSGQVNKRLVGQFRMPGFPFILITTDVLQEGEDLHTFCKRVLHYGLAWTPSSLEQRTGRIDRIGGLAQRSLDGMLREPQEDELIQVFYPHLRDTVELLQVRRVLRRLNTFMQLIHKNVPTNREDSSLDANVAVHEEESDLPQYKKPLKSAFEVEEQWLDGKLGSNSVSISDWTDRYERFKSFVKELTALDGIEFEHKSDHDCKGYVNFTNEFRPSIFNRIRPPLGVQQKFRIRLRSHVAGEEILFECESPIAELDLHNEFNMDSMCDVIQKVDYAKISNSTFLHLFNDFFRKLVA